MSIPFDDLIGQCFADIFLSWYDYFEQYVKRKQSSLFKRFRITYVFTVAKNFVSACRNVARAIS